MELSKTLKSEFLWLWFFRIAIALGVGVTLANLIFNRGLWLDEAMLSLNLVNRNYLELLEPLDMNQVAPIGYLWLVKSFVALFGDHEWALRLPSFLFYLGSIVMFFRICRRYVANPIFVWMACAIFCLNFRVSYYAIEVKQYAGDLFLALTMIELCLSYCKEQKIQMLVWLTIVGSLSIWFSNIAVLCLFSLGLYLLIDNRQRNRGLVKDIWMSGFCWVTSFAVYYYFFIHDHPTRDFMMAFWAKWDGFFPKEVISLGFFQHLFYVITTIFEELLVAYMVWPFFILLYSYGLYRFRQQCIDPKAVYLFVFPIILHLILSALWLYPFSMRLILYLYPLILILLIFGYEGIYLFLRKNRKRLGSLVIALPILLSLTWHIARYPIDREEMRDAMFALQKEIMPGERIYLYCNSNPTYQFYLMKDEFNKLQDMLSSTVFGQVHSEMVAMCDYTHIVELETPFWAIFSSVTPYDIDDVVIDQEKEAFDLLRKHNYRVTKKLEFRGVRYYKIEK